MALKAFKKSGYETIVYKEAKENETENLIKNANIIIDALLGIGSRKTVLEPYLKIIDIIIPRWIRFIPMLKSIQFNCI